MSSKVATHIRLPEEILKMLKYKAIEERKSVNQLIQEAIERDLGVQTPARTDAPDSFDSLIGSVRSGAADGSVSHDDYLYGARQ